MVLRSKKERQVIEESPKKLRWPARRLPALQTDDGARERNGIGRYKCPISSNQPDSNRRRGASRDQRQNQGHRQRRGKGAGCATSVWTCRQWERRRRQRRRGRPLGCASGL